MFSIRSQYVLFLSVACAASQLIISGERQASCGGELLRMRPRHSSQLRMVFDMR